MHFVYMIAAIREEKKQMGASETKQLMYLSSDGFLPMSKS